MYLLIKSHTSNVPESSPLLSPTIPKFQRDTVAQGTVYCQKFMSEVDARPTSPYFLCIVNHLLHHVISCGLDNGQLWSIEQRIFRNEEAGPNEPQYKSLRNYTKC